MQKIIVILALLLAILLPATVSAAAINGGREYTVPATQTVNDNLYLAAGNLVVLGNTLRDAVFAAGNLNLDGRIGQDLLAAGGMLNLSGQVIGDGRFVGGNLSLTGRVLGDFLFAAGEAHLASGSRVNGDLIAAAGRLVVEGDVAGSLLAAGGEVVINGHVAGPVNVWAEHVVLGEKAVIEGDLVYHSANQAKVDPKAVVRGETTFQSVKDYPVFAEGTFLNLLNTWRLIFLFSLAITGLVLFYLMPRIFRGVVLTGLEVPGKAILWGILGFLFLPFVVAALFFTLLGLPLGILVGLTYLKLLLVAKIFAGTIFGVWLIRLAFRSSDYEVNWQAVVGGLLLLFILGRVPYLGFALTAIFYLLSFGSCIIFIYRRFLNRG